MTRLSKLKGGARQAFIWHTLCFRDYKHRHRFAMIERGRTRV